LDKHTKNSKKLVYSIVISKKKSKGQGARSREQGAKSRGHGARSKEQGAGSRGHGSG
jgi:hypothetical protein